MFAFLNTAMSNGIQRFFNFELGRNGEEGAKKVYNTAVIIQLILGVVILIGAEGFGAWYINNKMVKYKSSFLMIYCSRLNENDKLFIFNEANDKVYDVYESESPLTLDKTEMTMIKMLGNFVDEDEIKKFKC